MASKDQSPARLDSWKEIAVYLGRGERTVKRWEVERSLPVHRLPGGRGSVYAFANELDEWLRSEKENLDGQEALKSAEDSDSLRHQPELALGRDAISEENASRRPARLWLLALALIVIVAAATALMLRGKNATVAGAAPKLSSDRNAANELYLRGRYEWNKRTPESLVRAFVLFTQAVVHDPSFAPAYAGLADTYNLRREFAGMPEKEAYERAIAAATKAIELDDSLAEAHRSLAFALTNGKWDFTNGEREYLRAIQLNPNDPITHLWFANSYQGFDRWDAALGEIDRAQKLDPTSSAILADRGNMLFNSGSTAEGIQLMQQAQRSEPQFLSPHVYLARAYLQTGNYRGFLEESEEVARLTNDPVLRKHVKAARDGFMRDSEHGLLPALYAAQKESVESGEIHPTVLALTCVLMGKKDEALELVEQDIHERSGYALFLVELPAFEALKDDPKYQARVAELHRPARR